MRCLTPVTIKNPQTGSLGAVYDTQYIQVPCKKCTICMKRRAQQWVFRLQQEHLHATTAAFMTYTYNNESLPFSPNGLPTLHQKHHTDFMKRLRKKISKDYPSNQSLRYYAVGEYGGTTERPHYHAILFNLPKKYIDKPEIIESIWQHGIITADKVSAASIAYVCGYVNKQKYFTTDDPQDDRNREFSVMSKHLGERWLSEQRINRLKTLLEPITRVEDGKIIAIPKYFLKKALTPEEILVISQKCLEHFEGTADFPNEQHHIDYVKVDALKRKRKSQTRNKN